MQVPGLPVLAMISVPLCVLNIRREIVSPSHFPATAARGMVDGLHGLGTAGREEIRAQPRAVICDFDVEGCIAHKGSDLTARLVLVCKFDRVGQQIDHHLLRLSESPKIAASVSSRAISRLTPC